MNDIDREFAVRRLLSNQRTYQLFVIANPSIKLLADAQLIYRNFLYEHRFDEVLHEQDCDIVLIDRELLDPNFKEIINKLHTALDNAKINLYLNSFKPSEVTKIKKTIASIYKQLFTIGNTRTMLHMYTIEYQAELIKQKFILEHTISDTSTLDDIWQDILIYVNNNTLSTKDCRDISHSDQWSPYWRVGKPNPFNCPIGELTDEQKSVIIFSHMYDSIFENSERPSESVIDDDDMLDGWLLLQRKEREKEIAQRQVNKNIGNSKISSADEIFIPVNSIDDAMALQKLNTPEAAFIKQQRMNVINQKGEARDLDFVDRQAQALQEAKRG